MAAPLGAAVTFAGKGAATEDRLRKVAAVTIAREGAATEDRPYKVVQIVDIRKIAAVTMAREGAATEDRPYNVAAVTFAREGLLACAPWRKRVLAPVVDRLSLPAYFAKYFLQRANRR